MSRASRREKPIHSEPPIKVYFGIATHVSAAEGDCSTLTFGFYGSASWDYSNKIQRSGLKAQLPTCDVKITSPEENTPAELWIVKQHDGTEVAKLYLKDVQIPFEDCG